MKSHLFSSGKYNFLMEQCPRFHKRVWVSPASRAERIPLARLFLSSHRLIIEAGRWKRWEHKQRICPICKSLDTLFICQNECIHEDERCLGFEAHYLWYCPLTN